MAIVSLRYGRFCANANNSSESEREDGIAIGSGKSGDDRGCDDNDDDGVATTVVVVVVAVTTVVNDDDVATIGGIS